MEEAYYLYCAIPGAGAEGIFGDEIPVHGENLPLVFLPRLDRKFIQRYVEELDGTIAGCDDKLILMGFGPREVV